MSIFETIRAENEKTLKLMRKLEDTSIEQPDERTRVLEDARTQIESLAQAVDSILYPLLAVEDATRDAVARARDQQRELEGLLRDLAQQDPASDEFTRTAALLSGTVRQHILHEEQVLFPVAARTVPGDQLDELDARMSGHKAELVREQREERAP